MFAMSSFNLVKGVMSLPCHDLRCNEFVLSSFKCIRLQTLSRASSSMYYLDFFMVQGQCPPYVWDQYPILHLHFFKTFSTSKSNVIQGTNGLPHIHMGYKNIIKVQRAPSWSSSTSSHCHQVVAWHLKLSSVSKCHHATSHALGPSPRVPKPNQATNNHTNHKWPQYGSFGSFMPCHQHLTLLCLFVTPLSLMGVINDNLSHQFLGIPKSLKHRDDEYEAFWGVPILMQHRS